VGAIARQLILGRRRRGTIRRAAGFLGIEKSSWPYSGPRGTGTLMRAFVVRRPVCAKWGTGRCARDREHAPAGLAAPYSGRGGHFHCGGGGLLFSCCRRRPPPLSFPEPLSEAGYRPGRFRCGGRVMGIFCCSLSFGGEVSTGRDRPLLFGCRISPLSRATQPRCTSLSPLPPGTGRPPPPLPVGRCAAFVDWAEFLFLCAGRLPMYF